jgi:hypothetical protein
MGSKLSTDYYQPYVVGVEVGQVCYGSNPCWHQIVIAYSDTAVVVTRLPADDIVDRYERFLSIGETAHLKTISH